MIRRQAILLFSEQQEQGQHPLQLSVFRPHPAERAHPAASAARESRRLFRRLPAPLPGVPRYPRSAAKQFQVWVKEQAGESNAPIVDAPKGRLDEFVDPYFTGARPDQIVVILRAREPARIMTAIGDRKANRWNLQIADRWIVQYNFYVKDREWGGCSSALPVPLIMP